MMRTSTPSRFEITVSRSNSGKSFIEDSYFTSPFKIMKPFERENGGISVFLQTASPGILEGDAQEHKITVKKGACLEIKSQSFEKIFKMDDGKSAERKISAEVQENSTLIYTPLPCIPYSKSNFFSKTEIHLSSSSRLIYEDCICAGRCARGEIFDFTLYRNLVKIFRDGKLVYRDNLFLEGSNAGSIPKAKKLLQGKTMFGDFTHCASLLLFGFKSSTKEIRKALSVDEKLLYTDYETKKEDSGANIIAEVNENDSGDFIIRCLSKSAESIQKTFEKIKLILK